MKNYKPYNIKMYVTNYEQNLVIIKIKKEEEILEDNQFSSEF
jgi:hypothetical protein